MTNTNKLTADYLTATYFDEDMNQYTLEFDNNILLDVDADIFEGKEITDDFFEDEENLKKAIEEGELR